MTEQEREKLVEAMCAAYWQEPGASTWEQLCESSPAMADDMRQGMQAALAAIDAAVDEHGNRIAWVAPWEATARMRAELSTHPNINGSMADWCWRASRDACLAERRGEGR